MHSPSPPPRTKRTPSSPPLTSLSRYHGGGGGENEIGWPHQEKVSAGPSWGWTLRAQPAPRTSVARQRPMRTAMRQVPIAGILRALGSRDNQNRARIVALVQAVPNPRRSHARDA